MWRSLGPTLEWLSIFGRDGKIRMETIAHIQIHCRNLPAVEIGFASYMWQAITGLLVSYGTQLKRSWVTDASGAPMPLSLLQSVLAACPNVRCDLAVMEEVDAPTIKALADHVDSIWGFDVACESFEAMSAAVHVEEIRLLTMETNDITDALQNIQLGAKPRLHSLRVDVREEGLLNDAFAIIAQDTGSLCRLELGLGKQERASWEGIASANPLLESVTIHLLLDSTLEEGN